MGIFGKAGRGALWATFWPAGAVASSRHGRKKDKAEILAAIQAATAQPVPASASQVAARRKEINQRLKAAGYTSKAQKDEARMRLARLTATDGKTVDEALEIIARDGPANPA